MEKTKIKKVNKPIPDVIKKAIDDKRKKIEKFKNTVATKLDVSKRFI